ncbi:MAG: hypothetical protein QNJ78_15775, partial [Gammaproteobacteria bacterium]|nr:hypothetical protein [Gammaproteobacteria bacterium]
MKTLIVCLLLVLTNVAYADDIKVRRCGNEAKSKIIDGFHFLQKTLKHHRGELTRCMDKAYLVEHSRKSAKEIVGLLDRPEVTKVICKKLEDANARAHRVYLKRGVLRMDPDFAKNSTNRRIASVIAHELMHNNGLNHGKNDVGSKYYKNTVNEQIESCILNGKPNPWPGPG